MAFFDCVVGGGSSTATITVSYDSSFYNKTITCSNGSKTYTATTTSSGSTTFKVNDEGTWTITCNGVSTTVEVVLNYTAQLAVTKTYTIYGAVGATITFTDITGSKTVTLDSNGAGSAQITFIPPSQNIVFTDTNVAKNPNNLSESYSKTIAVTNDMSAIYVCPDKALYWWGYMKEVEACVGGNGWSGRFPLTAPTFSTNSVTIATSYNGNPSDFKQCGVANPSPIDLTNFAHVKSISTSGGTTTDGVCVLPSNSKYLNSLTVGGSLAEKATQNGTQSGNYWFVDLSIANISQTAYVSFQNMAGASNTLYALWIE